MQRVAPSAGGPLLRLVACPDCHRQFDVTHVRADAVPCPCGARVANERHTPVHARVHRCGSCGAGVGAEAETCAYCGAGLVRDERALSLLCPECYARNAEVSRFCTACGVAFDPEPVAGEAPELPCPDCGGLMPVRGVGGVMVNECPSCNGLWAPGEELDRLVGRAVEAARDADLSGLRGRAPRVAGSNPWRQPVRYRKCPACDAFMQRRNYRKCSGIILDRCHEHGTWLDADELEQMAGFIAERGGLPPEPRLESPRPVPTTFERAARYGSFSTSAESGGGRTVLELLASLLK